jgi:hypothetical protein
VARVHRSIATLLEALWAQFDPAEVAREGLLWSCR